MGTDAAENWTDLPPRGHYLAREVGRLAGVSGNTIGQWKRRGYISASQDPDGYPHVYSYQDVAEAMVVHSLIDHRVNLRHLRRAIEALRRERGTSWPLTNADLLIADRGDRAGHLVIEDHGEMFDAGEHRYDWQRLIETPELRRIATDLRRGGWAVREHPHIRHIQVDPDVLSGRPVIVGTRVPAETAGRLAQEPSGPDVLVKDYDLQADAIRDASTWWLSVRSFETEAA